jgi:hypothetical protein
MMFFKLNIIYDKIAKVTMEFKLPVPSVVPIIAPIVASNAVPIVVPMYIAKSNTLCRAQYSQMLSV